ncbi:hypothetical protein [Vogesella oryzae]|uniref:hypothetical protein n=1 Tax=Vogesella oryzae TaxID=1735285 RepID=UPI0015835DC9|nr:hypothetical protein [Vogesella oryzae]
MKSNVAVSLLLGALLTSACATQTLDVPRADNYAASSQKKARAVHHWEVLAEDVATRVADKLQTKALSKAVYVVPVANSAFHQGFRKLLINQLLAKGVEVATRPGADCVDLKVDAQLVRHNSSAGNSVQLKATSLAAGIAVLRDLTFQHSATAYTLIGLAAGAGIDAANLSLNGTASGGPTRTEVLITTEVEANQRYIASTSDVYYIEREDAGLYTAQEPMNSWKVVGQ